MAQYSDSECAHCYQANNPSLAMSDPNVNKTEVHLHVMLKVHFRTFGHCEREVVIDVDGHKRRMDFVLAASKAVIELDGRQHHVVVDIFKSDPDEIRATDVAKTLHWFKTYPLAPFIRILQPLVMPGYPVNQQSDITFDYVSAIYYAIENVAHHGVVTFVERAGTGEYDAHKAAYTQVGIRFLSIDPRTFEFGQHKLPDLRAAFSL